MRDLIRPSVYSVSRLCPGTGQSTGSYGITPAPSGAPGGIVQERGGAVRTGQQRRRVTGAGDAEGAAARVVDRAQTGGDLVLLQVAGGQVQPGQQPLGRDVERHQGPGHGAQPAHGRGGGQPAPHHVAHHQRRTAAGQRDDVEPVAAHGGRITGRVVARGHLEAGRTRAGAGEQGALQRDHVFALAPVEPGVVDVHGRLGRQLHGQRDVGLGERRPAPRPDEVGETQQHAARATSGTTR